MALRPTQDKSKLVRISSNDKQSGINSSFSLRLPSVQGETQNVKAIGINSIQCPNVFDNVASYNNILGLVKTTGAVSYDIPITTGYYSITSFIAQLQTDINLVIPDVVAVTLVGTSPTQKINFAFTGDTYAFDFSETSIWRQIGLEQDIGGSASSTMPNIVNLIGVDSVYVHCRSFASGNLIEADGVFSVVDKVPMDKPYGSMCYTNYGTSNEHYIQFIPSKRPLSFNQITVRLRDVDGNLLTLPSNFDFSMMLKIYHI